LNLNPRDIQAEIQERVRANVLSAAIGAGCLIYFGYFRSGTPTVTNLFSAGDAVFVWTLRIGGVLLLLAALWCWTGMLLSLMADAIVSTAIGAGLIASALMMMLGGGTGINQLLYIVFGVMFTGSGLRNGRDFMSLGKLLREAGDFQGQPHVPQAAAPPMTPPSFPAEQASPAASTVGSLASELRRRKSVLTDYPTDDPYASEEPADAGFAADEIAGDEFAGSEVVDDVQSDDAPLEDSPPEAAQSDEPPPDGFLSSFADEDTPRDV